MKLKIVSNHPINVTILVVLIQLLLPGLAKAALAIGAVALPEPTIIERTPHSRTWQTVSQVQIGDKTRLRTNSYQELATGMHYLKDGQLAEAQATINLVNGYGVADQGLHKAVFSPSITNTPAVDYEDPDRNRFQSRILGLAYLDAQSGKSVMFCVTKDSLGTIQGGTVLYPDAFSDNVRCDVIYSYNRDSFSQEIAILAQLPPPASFQLNEKTTRLQIWTELFAPPEPKLKQTTVIYQETDPAVRQTMAEPDLKDDFLSFGQLQIGRGKAFAVDTDAIRQAGINVAEEIVVSKEWSATPEGRRFLIESVEMSLLRPLLDTLPLAAVQKQNDPNGRLASLKTALPRAEFLASLPPPTRTGFQPTGRSNPGSGILQPSTLPRTTRSLRTALPEGQANGPKKPYPRREQGVVLDYVALITAATNFTFRADSTYFCSGNVNLSGITTCEGGAVVKLVNIR